MKVFVAVEHGECEVRLCEYLSHWLRLDILPVTRQDGKETVSLRESGEFLKQLSRIREDIGLRGHVQGTRLRETIQAYSTSY